MPLCINVGLNRKASQDYQSSGASINITAELDATLLSKPQALQEAIDGLYEQARVALDRQSPLTPPGGPPQAAELPARGNGHAGGGANGHAGSGARPITPRQRSAILSIARQADLDAAASARRTFGVELDQLTTRQASKLIDSLKE
ncbi:MAG TPA: hypothetical protein VK797_12185 [Tepidisphaeraceae bacterium]|jgi:hypothetical protein|nr:hypothetical protein [Tepidisphaeraceae bacterium]